MSSPDAISFLAEAGQTLASSLDYSVTLQRVADLAVPDLADFCIVELTQDGGISGLAVAHVDPEAADAFREARRRFPPSADQSTPGATALRTGRAQLIAEIDEAQLVRAIADPEHRALIARLQARSILTVPMVARDRAVGVLSLGFAGSGRRFGPADTPLAEDLANRVAAAVDSARLYEEAQAALGDQERSRALLDTVVWSAPVGLAFFDTDLRYLKVNATLAEINGIAVDEHVGRRVDELASGIPSSVADDLRQVRETGAAIRDREVETETASAPHERRTWISSYYPVFSPSGELFALGAVVLEITERKRLLEAERRARTQAEQAAARLARLQQLTSALSRAADVARVANVVVTEGVAGLGAASGAVCLLSADGAWLETVAHRGMEISSEELHRFSLDSQLPAAEAVRRGELVVFSSQGDRDARYPALAGLPFPRPVYAVVPLMADGRPLGAAAFGFPPETTISDDDRRFLSALGDQCGQALDRSRLLVQERAARADAERANARLAFLAEASRILASSLHVEQMLGDLAGVIVPELADACAVHLLQDGALQLVAATRTGEGDGQGRDPGDPTEEAALREVARTGASRLPDDLGASMAVPLAGPNGVVGVLALTTDGSKRRFGPSDVSLMQDLARRAGVAIENAMVMRERNRVLHLLQQSLLPPSTPELPGLEVAVRYHPVGDGSEVGGDFYDIFPVEPGVYGVIIGDVVGKGVAAASLTAQARYTVRTAARHGRSPSEVLDFLNSTIVDAGVGEQFCTIAYAEVRPGTEGTDVVLACGGHPLPFCLTAGVVRPVGIAGRAVGLLPDADTTDAAVRLDAGDTLVLYTDGLLEVRSPDGEFAPDLLIQTLETCAGLGAEEVAATVDAALLRFQGGRVRDDMALVVLRAPSPGPGRAAATGP